MGKMRIVLFLLLALIALSPAMAEDRVCSIEIDYSYKEDADSALRKSKKLEVTSYFSEEEQLVRYDFKALDRTGSLPVIDAVDSGFVLTQNMDEFKKLIAVFDKAASWKSAVRGANITISDKRPLRDGLKEMPVSFSLSVDVAGLLGNYFDVTDFISSDLKKTENSVVFDPWFVKRGDEILLGMNVSKVNIDRKIIESLSGILTQFYGYYSGAGSTLYDGGSEFDQPDGAFSDGYDEDDWDDWFFSDQDSQAESSFGAPADDEFGVSREFVAGTDAMDLSGMISPILESAISSYAPGIEISERNFDLLYRFLKETEQSISEYRSQREILDRLLI